MRTTQVNATPGVVTVTGATAATGPYGKQERNAPCACGSGKKYKRCHYVSDHEKWRQAEITRRAQWAHEAAQSRIEREELIRQGRSIPPGRTIHTRRGALATLALLAASVNK